jgi:hypothetical protein
MHTGKIRCLSLLLILSGTLLFACSARLGWGVLLWSTEDPPIASGTILPVYIRSNLNKVWVVGLPEGMKRNRDGINKIEIPLSRLELAGSKSKARKRAAAFARYARTYAENLQDGLPIRDNPENTARRVYRLRYGEIIKVLSLAEGIPAISATGDPLPGDWYRVLAEDGTTGYCFSYRLKLFEHGGGLLAASVPLGDEFSSPDPDLDALLSKTWSPESYLNMVNNQKIDLDDFFHHWCFDPGAETGIARVYIPGVDRTFSYNAIRPDGQRAWRFEGSNLLMHLRSDTTLAVQFTEGEGGGMRTLLFVALPIPVDDLIMQESARRERLYETIFTQGPVFTSNNYGTITFGEEGTFFWQGYDLLVPQHLPESVTGYGEISIDLFLILALEDRYNGAFTMYFEETDGGETTALQCMYALDNQGFRIEIAPESTIDGNTVVRRAVSPMVLYFFKDDELW